MKFNLKKDRTLVLGIQNKETLETEVLTVNGNYGINLFFDNQSQLKGIYHGKLPAEQVMKWAAEDLDQLTQERNKLKEEVKRLKEVLQLK